MAKGDYLKKVEADYLGQHDGWKAAAHAVGATVGFSLEDLADIDADNAALHADIAASKKCAERAGDTQLNWHLRAVGTTKPAA